MPRQGGSIMRSIALVSGFTFLGLLLAAPASADMIHYQATVSPSTEVPPNGSKATGHLTATYDTSSRTLTYEVGYADLTGPATMAQFSRTGTGGEERRRHGADHRRSRQSDQRVGDADRRSGESAYERGHVLQYPYRDEQRR